MRKKLRMTAVLLIMTLALTGVRSQTVFASNNTWTVTDLTSFNEAVEEIKSKRDTNGLSEATIVLTQDITFEAEDYQNSVHIGDNYFSGVEDVTITLTSDENGPYKVKRLGATYSHNQQSYLGFEGANQGSGADARLFIGPLILDNIILDTHKDDYYFAQGHKLVFTENFQNTSPISVVGGNLGTQRRLDGQGFESYDKPGLTNDGKVAAWKTEKEGVASTRLEIRGGNFIYVIAGGYNSDVKGDTYVNVALNPDNNKHHVSNLFGGGKYNKETDSDRCTRATVCGNTNVYAISGKFGDIFGGAENYSGIKNCGVVQGDSHVVVGQATGNAKAYFNNAYGGSQGGTMGWQDYNDGRKWKGGDTHITIENTAEGRGNLVADVMGGGARDTVHGTTEVTLNGGENVHWVFAGGANDDNDKTAHILNENKKETAAKVIVNGGEWNQIYSTVKTNVGTTQPQEVKGNVVIDFNGGKVNSFHLSSFMTHTSGDSSLNIYGGEFGNMTHAILGYRSADVNGNTEQSGKVDGKRIVNIRNNKQMKCWQIYAIDEINVKNTKPFIARGNTKEGALLSCGNVNIQKGTLALTGENSLVNMESITGKKDINGDFHIEKDATLALNGTNDNIQAPGCINANGAASGNGKLWIVRPNGADWIKPIMISHQPKVGEVYLRAQNTNEPAPVNSKANLLTLANDAPELYVEYTKDAEAIGNYTHAWRIAEAQTLTVTFDKNGGDTEADPKTKKIPLLGGASSGKIDTLPAPPTRSGYDFTGWNTKSDGTGDAFTVDTLVEQDITVYAQWEKEAVPEPTYTVTYTDGVEDETIFEDQSYGNLKKDSETPKYQGTPSREGYTFEGWTPEWKDTVTGDITYTAQWKKIGEVVPEPTYTVTYTDGVENETIFEDQSYGNLKKGDKTPEYQGTPSREGYTFEGWTPEWKDTVTGDITYTAQWKKIGEVVPEPTYTVTYTDGVENETIFEDQSYGNLKKGEKTPEYQGTPSREGYTFEGWTPEWKDTVIGDITYTAQWKKIAGGDAQQPSEPEKLPSEKLPSETRPSEKLPSKEDSAPKTGDNANVELWILLMAAAFSFIAVISVKKQK